MNELFNFYGLAFAILLALPHILYRRRHPTDPGDCPNKGMVILYWALWLLFFRRSSRWLANLIVAVSAAAAIMSGILQVNTLLVSFGIVYLIGELYIVKCVIPK